MLQGFLQFIFLIFSIISILLTIWLSLQRLKKRQSFKIPRLEKPHPILKEFQFLQLCEHINNQLDELEKSQNNISVKFSFYSILSNALELSIFFVGLIGIIIILSHKEHTHYTAIFLSITAGLLLYAYFVSLAATKIFEYSKQSAERAIRKVQIQIAQVKNEISHLEIIQNEMQQKDPGLKPSPSAGSRDIKM